MAALLIVALIAIGVAVSAVATKRDRDRRAWDLLVTETTAVMDASWRQIAQVPPCTSEPLGLGYVISAARDSADAENALIASLAQRDWRSALPDDVIPHDENVRYLVKDLDGLQASVAVSTISDHVEATWAIDVGACLWSIGPTDLGRSVYRVVAWSRETF